MSRAFGIVLLALSVPLAFASGRANGLADPPGRPTLAVECLSQGATTKRQQGDTAAVLIDGTGSMLVAVQAQAPFPIEGLGALCTVEAVYALDDQR